MELQELENFLIKNSVIDKKFITDFFGFQKKILYKSYEPFTINLDDIAYWLEAVKGNLKATLVESYNKISDYKIIKNIAYGHTEAKKGGQNKELILVTSDCFKMLCMRTNTKKSKQVQKYYIELEKLLDKYKNVIIEQQNKKIKILENDLKKQDYPQEGRCYIFEEIDELEEKYYRIGQSDNLKKRMNTHNSSSSHNKIVVFEIKTNDIYHYEKCLRSTLYRFKYKNDFFRAPLDLIKKSIKNCKYIIKTFKNNDLDNLTGGANKMYKIINKKDIDNFDEYKINNDLKIYFSKMCDCVMWNLYEKPEEAYFSGRKVTPKKLNEIIIPESYINKILILPCQRDSEYYENLSLSFKKYTYKELFMLLYDFYNKEKLEIKKLKQIPNDVSGYVKDAIKDSKNKSIYRIDLVGNLCRFEDVRQISENIYKLILGS
jgi:phage anti-repressor protein